MLLKGALGDSSGVMVASQVNPGRVFSVFPGVAQLIVWNSCGRFSVSIFSSHLMEMLRKRGWESVWAARVRTAERAGCLSSVGRLLGMWRVRLKYGQT